MLKYIICKSSSSKDLVLLQIPYLIQWELASKSNTSMAFSEVASEDVKVSSLLAMIEIWKLGRYTS